MAARPPATSTPSSRSYSPFPYIDGLNGRQYPQFRVSRVQRTPICLIFMSPNYDDRLQNRWKSSNDRWLGRGCRRYPRANWRACLVFPGTKKEAPNLASGTAPRARIPATARISPFWCTAYIHGSNYAGTLLSHFYPLSGVMSQETYKNPTVWSNGPPTKVIR